MTSHVQKSTHTNGLEELRAYNNKLLDKKTLYLKNTKYHQLKRKNLLK